MKKYLEHIGIDPAVMVGKPVVKGTRIPVERVIGHLADTLDLNDLFAAFPDLTIEDVKACHAYAGNLVQHDRGRLARSARRTSAKAPA